MIISIDSLGRIVIPKKIRDNLSINEFDSLEIKVEDEKIVLIRMNPERINMEEFLNRFIIYKFGPAYKDIIIGREISKNIEDLLTRYLKKVICIHEDGSI